MEPPVKKKRSMYDSPSPEPTEPAKILDPELEDVLVYIANMLDPKSLVRFSKTCKPIHDACMKASVDFRIDRTLRVFSGPFFTPLWRPRYGALSDAQLVEVSEGPFIVRFSKISIENEIDEDFLESIRDYLECFSVQSVRSVSLLEECTDENGLIEFLREYDVREIETKTAMSEKLLQFILELQLDYFKCLNSIENFIKLSIPRLHLAETKISDPQLKDILQRFLNDRSLLRWTIGWSSTWAAVSACFETLPRGEFFASKPFPSHRPIYLTNGNFWKASKPAYNVDDNEPLHVLSRDGHVVECIWEENNMISLRNMEKDELRGDFRKMLV